MTAQTPAIDHELDITAEVCPMTFVKTKLLIERMKPGQTCRVRLAGAEPLDNVPRSVAELGHEIVSVMPEGADDGPEAVHLIVIRKT